MRRRKKKSEMTDERLTELNDRYWHMNPNPRKVPFAPGVTPEFTICRSCSAFVWEQEVHDSFHDGLIQRRATFARENSDGSVTMQFIDGTRETFAPDHFARMSGDALISLLREINDGIEPGWAERNPKIDE
jgi:hypothetical protein